MHRKKIWLGLASLIALLLFLAGCQASSSKAAKTSSMPKISGFTYTGKIPENPKKVVNFAYSYTGYLLKLGVNVSSYSLDYEKDSPAFGNQLKQAKKLQSSDTEAIAAQKPDLIIAFSTDQNLDKLKKIAPVLVITYGKHDYLDMMTQLGKVFGKEKEAQNWLDSWKQQVATAKKTIDKSIASDATFTVMDFYGKDIYLYGNNWGRGGELVYDSLGYKAPQKVQDDVFKTGYFGVSQEAIGEYIGDYVILNSTKASADSTNALTESDVWKNTTAYKNKHVFKVDEALFYFSDPLSLESQLKTFVNLAKDQAK